jgi:transposase-like protein
MINKINTEVKVTNVVCKSCTANDSREFKEAGNFITYVCPRCAYMWTEEKGEKK